MKPKLRDYLTIFAALFAIFLCGYGVGYLTGEKKGRLSPHPRTLIDQGDETGNWENRTMERLTRLLELSEAQRPDVEKIIKSTGIKIKTSRDEAVEDYFRSLLQLHDDLLPLLQPDQQEKIKKDRKNLQKVIKARFHSFNEE